MNDGTIVKGPATAEPTPDGAARPLYCFTNHTDTVIAHDADDALAISVECGWSSADPGDRNDPFVRVDDVTPIALWVEDAPDAMQCECITWARENLAAGTPNGHHRECPVGRPRKTAREWIVEQGRGLLCSTEQ